MLIALTVLFFSRALLGCSKEVSTLKLQTSKIDIESIKSQINDEEGEIPLFSKVCCDSEKVWKLL